MPSPEKKRCKIYTTKDDSSIEQTDLASKAKSDVKQYFKAWHLMKTTNFKYFIQRSENLILAIKPFTERETKQPK